MKKILFVCLGNICRSPAAEAVFLKLLEKYDLSKNFIVDSAGTGAWHVGKKADLRMRSAAEKRGIIIKSLARQITVSDLSKFDLIITMDNDNYLNLQNMVKTLGSEKVADIRTMLSYSSKFNLTEVPDPYYGRDDGFDHVLDILEDSCQSLLNCLIN